ncbi:DUF1684 domain-containing protein [Actinoplanes derwentensis]|uniref:DUF1684 domain-containing protein n=1 Tax=Actinoplanes derwentensis TaxID=113562 RepID=A0A1H2AQS0_9ACTN|nr:DUF1684 domain-containing protein [Actinoplanes derwentensis]GID84384.1 hypothetical protein Ade03nite_33080 [Actinoplanes derwentensis]SDT48261.1 hypothetical protein SAMN04489716_4026 [Actinoplanes derwentensis]
MTISFQEQWDQWHAAHEKRRADPHGFLAITGLHWLTDTPQRFDDAPGDWSTGPDGVTVALAEGESLTLSDQVITGTHTFAPIAERADVTVTFGDAKIEIAKRGGFDVVRPRHPSSPVLAAYPGTPAFPADEKWQVTGRYVAFDAPQSTTVGSVAEGIEHVYEAPGRIEFDLGGSPRSLTVFNGYLPGTLSVLFTDETSGLTTYAANRSLLIDAPAADGTVTIDFNRAVNLPCAYTEFATCPLPPAGNRLGVAVEAGEKKPD